MEEHVWQSLPYLKDAQATLREAALTFIGEPQPPGSLFWQPGPGPHYYIGSKGQPCGCRRPGCPEEGPPHRWAHREPCSVLPPLATIRLWGQAR